MTSYAIFRCPDGTQSRTEKIISFNFIKESYIPYTQLSGTFIAEDSENDFFSAYNYSEVIFFVGGHKIHHGIIDYLDIKTENGVKKGIFKSRGFTSLLLDNQLQPGLYMNVSIDSLINQYYQIPEITHEESTSQSYIFVKSGSSMWDAVVNLSYKLYGSYPYISGTNKVAMTINDPQTVLVLSDDMLIECGSTLNTRRIASGFHMSDLDDTYGNFEYTNPEAVERKIIRNRYFELDRRFLYEPSYAMGFRNAMAMRGWKRDFCVYSGYSGEDLYDSVSFADVSNARIREIRIRGDKSGIKTELSVYHDNFM